MFDFNDFINQPGAWIFLFGFYGIMVLISLLIITFMLYKCEYHQKDS